MSQNLNTKNVVVTGAAGYIGGITCIELQRKGYNVFGIDRRFVPHLNKFYNEFIQTDFLDYESLLLIKRAKPIAIIHCAGTSLVGPSFTSPGIYFDNNVGRTNRFLNFVKDEFPTTKFIFSSSAAVYGNYSTYPYREYMDTNPVSPYGESKLMVEKMLDWFNKAYNLNYVSLRYFNACGADIEAEHGQEPDATHIFAKLFYASMTGKPFNLNGESYPTKDKTCIRDYVHVSDIAEAHIKCIDANIKGVYNLGTFKGVSNLDCIKYVEEYTNKKINVNVLPPRDGDPAILIADPTKFNIATGWKAWRTIPMVLSHLDKWYSSKTFDSLINNKRS